MNTLSPEIINTNLNTSKMWIIIKNSLFKFIISFNRRRCYNTDSRLRETILLKKLKLSIY